MLILCSHISDSDPTILQDCRIFHAASLVGSIAFECLFLFTILEIPRYLNAIVLIDK